MISKYDISTTFAVCSFEYECAGEVHYHPIIYNVLRSRSICVQFVWDSTFMGLLRTAIDI